MHRQTTAATLTVLLLAAIAAPASAEKTSKNVLTKEQQAQGWKTLFNGSSLSGWKARGKSDAAKFWKIEDGDLVLKVTKGAPDLVYTEEQFEDFEYAVDWKTQGNSGVFFRMSSIKDWLNTGPEIQVLPNDNVWNAKRKGRSKHGIGSLYDLIYPTQDFKGSRDKWMNYHVVCAGPVISVKLNGKVAFSVDLDDDYWQKPRGKFKLPYGTLPRKGYFMLQSHGASVAYRNIMVRPLTKAEAKATAKSLDKSKKDDTQTPPVYTGGVSVPKREKK